MEGDRTRFHTTRWSVVLTAADASSALARASMQELCGRYWFPLYAHARRRGYTDDEGRDHVQAFFAAMLERNTIQSADPRRGKFRSFILRCFENHLTDARASANAAKRGASVTHIQLDADPELLASLEAPPHSLPEAMFERDWALALLRGVLAELRAEYAARGQEPLFVRLSSEMGGVSVSYREAAQELGMTDGALRVAAHRFRARYGERLRAAVADTLEDGGDVDAELRSLIAALGGAP